MDLKEFVAKTIVGVLAGVREAQDSIPTERGASVANLPREQQQLMEFDIALSASDKSGAGGSVQVPGLQGGGETESVQGSVSRIRFKVPISFPLRPRGQ